MRKILESKSLQGIFTLSLAPILMQALSVFTMPIISRLYSPDMFASFGSFTALMGVIGIFMGFGYHNAILITRDRKGINTLFGLILSSMVLALIILVIGLFLIDASVRKFFNLNISTTVVLLLSSLGHGVYLYLNAVALKFGHYKQIAKSRVLRVLINKGFIIFSGIFLTATSFQLIVGELLGTFFIVIGLLSVAYKEKALRININGSEIMGLVRRYIDFPKYVMTSDLLFRLRKWLILSILIDLFTSEDVGLYVFAISLLAIPTNVISSAVGEVFFKFAADAPFDKIKSTLTTGIPIMIFTGGLIFFVISAFDDSLYIWLFGSNWVNLASVVAVASIAAISDFIVGPMMSIEKVTGFEKNILALQFNSMLLGLIGVYVGHLFNEFIYSLIGFSIGVCVSNIFAFITIFKRYNLRVPVIFNAHIGSFAFLIIGKALLFILSTQFSFIPGIISELFVVVYFLLSLYLLAKMLLKLDLNRE